VEQPFDLAKTGRKAEQNRRNLIDGGKLGADGKAGDHEVTARLAPCLARLEAIGFMLDRAWRRPRYVVFVFPTLAPLAVQPNAEPLAAFSIGTRISSLKQRASAL